MCASCAEQRALIPHRGSTDGLRSLPTARRLEPEPLVCRRVVWDCDLSQIFPGVGTTRRLGLAASAPGYIITIITSGMSMPAPLAPLAPLAPPVPPAPRAPPTTTAVLWASPAGPAGPAWPKPPFPPWPPLPPVEIPPRPPLPPVKFKKPPETRRSSSVGSCPR